ncbi:hypothetical protein OG923_33905 (plasmid) [Streptomyces halstedii]|uniref:hypothetical protein n=1 Tax=Streptomyces halstedii TaxID=1944 RepID=UPI002F9155E6
MTEIDTHHFPAELTARLRQAADYMRTVGYCRSDRQSGVTLKRAISDCVQLDGRGTVLEVLASHPPYLGVSNRGWGHDTEAEALAFLDTRVIEPGDLETVFGPGWPGVVRVVRAVAVDATPEAGRALAERYDVMWEALDDFRCEDANDDDTETPTTRAIAQEYFDRNSHTPVPPEAARLRKAVAAVKEALSRDAVIAAEAAGSWALSDDAAEAMTQTQGVMMRRAAQLAVLAEAGRHRITAEQYDILAAPLIEALDPEAREVVARQRDAEQAAERERTENVKALEAFEADYSDVQSTQVTLMFEPEIVGDRMVLQVCKVERHPITFDECQAVSGGRFLSVVLDTPACTAPAGTAPANFSAGKAEAKEKLREHGFGFLWQDNWRMDDGLAYTDTYIWL